MHRKSLRRRWLLLAAFMSIHCGRVERRTQTTVEVDGRYGQAIEQAYGCEGQPVDAWEHRQIGGSAAVRHESSSGAVAGARLRILQSEITRSTTYVAPDEQTYQLGAFSAYGGYERRRFGFAAGGSIITLNDALDPDSLELLPFIQIKTGDLDNVWFEATFGTNDPLYFAQYFGAGIGVRGENHRFRAGGTFYGHYMFDVEYDPIDDVDYDEPLMVGSRAELIDLGLYVDAEWRPFGGLGLIGGFVFGPAPAARVGLTWTFGGDDGP